MRTSWCTLGPRTRAVTVRPSSFLFHFSYLSKTNPSFEPPSFTHNLLFRFRMRVCWCCYGHRKALKIAIYLFDYLNTLELPSLVFCCLFHCCFRANYQRIFLPMHCIHIVSRCCWLCEFRSKTTNRNLADAIEHSTRFSILICFYLLLLFICLWLFSSRIIS